MSTKAAEVTKIAVNCFLTTKISYANMLGQVLTLSGMEDEIDNVLKSIGSDDRIGKKYLKYGFGFGGPCFPKDVSALIEFSKEIGYELSLLKKANIINNSIRAQYNDLTSREKEQNIKYNSDEEE